MECITGAPLEAFKVPIPTLSCRNYISDMHGAST